MRMTPSFAKTLKSCGYLIDSKPIAEMNFRNENDAEKSSEDRYGFVFNRGRFRLPVDAMFRTGSTPVILFIDQGDREPDRSELSEWQELSWNFGLAPLLWVHTPTREIVFNSYAEPTRLLDDRKIAEFEVSSEIGRADLVTFFGRVAFDSGAFWNSPYARNIDRRYRVDAILLRELAALEGALVETELSTLLAQKLIGRTIFSQYLADRGLLSSDWLERTYGKNSIAAVIRDPNSATKHFDWMRTTFNGDLFPPDIPDEHVHIGSLHLNLLADFLIGREISTGQLSFLPFRFDVIPVELISSIYEQFAHSAAGDAASSQGLHYTPINLVDLALDQLFSELGADATVLDPACGSGVFLVEAMRRLVWRRSQLEPLTRRLIRDVLHNQVFGIDINPGALQVTAFSLYLAALELDPEIEGCEPAELRFGRLFGKSLFEGSFFSTPEIKESHFDAIVGNPPWTYRGGVVEDQKTSPARRSVSQPRRSPDWAFLWRAREHLKPNGRLAFLMKATPFFSLDKAAVEARNILLSSFRNTTLINFSLLRNEGLFPSVRSGGHGKNSSVRSVAGPAMLFVGSATASNELDHVVLANVPWSPNFRKQGILDLAADQFKVLPISRLRADAVLLKAGIFGNEREFGVIENMRMNPSYTTLGSWCRASGTRMEQGLQIGGGSKGDASGLFGLPFLDASAYEPVTLSAELPAFDRETVHRPRTRSTFRGPLVLCPEAGFAKAASEGRYSATFCRSDVAFTDSFVGISFHGKNERVAKLLCLLLNSKTVAFQLALGGSNIGLKQPKVEKIDLEMLMIPDLDKVNEGILRDASNLWAKLARSRHSSHHLQTIDELAAEIYSLPSADRRVIEDGLSTSKPLFIDTLKQQRKSVSSPSTDVLEEYGEELVHWLNTALDRAGPCRSTLQQAIELSPGYIGLKFDIERGPIRPQPRFNLISPTLFESRAVHELETREKYRRGQRFVRMYASPSIYVIKPNEARYWRLADAQNDFERIVSDLITQEPSCGLTPSEAVLDHDVWPQSTLHRFE